MRKPPVNVRHFIFEPDLITAQEYSLIGRFWRASENEAILFCKGTLPVVFGTVEIRRLMRAFSVRL
jgi:hypothetical protein